ncbi:hypothetical protein GGX14DRAFT_439906 [Mycena pura]|uniref:Matrin-type domain-containing protein n=1 Tax=Mycena pura TaxID=153505 RepID=A0AAD6VND7_9AGAR|nr:hypothetical protein GGX14DRAFT_439906 [Mycena pura]
MSEYWISKKKYFCKYCEIYIADDVPSRQQHENGLRHKGNLERFIRGIYKAGEKKKKDDEEERREMARVEQAAQIAFAQDVGAGRAKLDTSTPSASTSSRKPPPKPSNPWANYSTPKSLGYEDPDAASTIAEAQGYRTQGVAGDWEVATPSNAAPASTSEPNAKRSASDALDQEESREYKLRKKTLATGLGQIYDPGAISIPLKKEELVDPAPPPTAPLARPPEPSDDSKSKPKWTKLPWKKAGDPEGPIDVPFVKSEADEAPKKEEDTTTQFDESPTAANGTGIKSEPDTPSLPEAASESPIIFKKRRIPAGGSKGRR